MTFAEIRAEATLYQITTKFTPANIHESCFRSYAILNKVIELLEQATPPQVIIEIIKDLRQAPPVEKDIGHP